jgi:hypothetical protein
MKAFAQADATRLPLADDSVDLVLGSPPYMDARTYGIGAQRGVEEWIDFMLQCTSEAVRVSRGLVLWVVGGVTRNHCYWPGCEGLLYEWWKRGGRCWRPAFWHRVGIPGSGGKQWLRADIEYVLCFTKCKAYIPWAGNTANGHPPKWAPGGDMSYRNTQGDRKNGQQAPVGPVDSDLQDGQGIEERDHRAETRASQKKTGSCIKKVPEQRHKFYSMSSRGNDGERKLAGGRRVSRGHADGDTTQEDAYLPPVLANPGNLIKGIKVGGGMMGHKLAHENEAPYPQKLAEWFIRSYCELGGLVLDPFSGSGTTVAAAVALGRRGIGLDLRLNQCQLGRRRCAEIQQVMF